MTVPRLKIAVVAPPWFPSAERLRRHRVGVCGLLTGCRAGPRVTPSAPAGTRRMQLGSSPPQKIRRATGSGMTSLRCGTPWRHRRSSEISMSMSSTTHGRRSLSLLVWRYPGGDGARSGRRRAGDYYGDVSRYYGDLGERISFVSISNSQRAGAPGCRGSHRLQRHKGLGSRLRRDKTTSFVSRSLLRR